MKQRCYSASSKAAKYYKDKGIIICDEWKNDFEQFKRWALEHGYADNLTIDRIDSDGNYEPENCRWITREENSRRARISEPNSKRIYWLGPHSKEKNELIMEIDRAFPRMSKEQCGYLLGFAMGMADRCDDIRKAHF